MSLAHCSTKGIHEETNIERLRAQADRRRCGFWGHALRRLNFGALLVQLLSSECRRSINTRNAQSLSLPRESAVENKAPANADHGPSPGQSAYSCAKPLE